MHHVTLDSSFYSAMVGIYVVMVGIYVNNGLILRKMSVSHDPGDPFLSHAQFSINEPNTLIRNNLSHSKTFP